MAKIYTYQGETGNLSELCKKFDKKYDTILDRINKQGMTIEEAFEKEIIKIYTY